MFSTTISGNVNDLTRFLLTLMLLLQIRTNPNQKLFVSSADMLRPQSLSTITHVVRGEHISMDFYAAIQKADQAKNGLQGRLQNFLENLQRNLTTSTVLNTAGNNVDVDKTEHQLHKLKDLFAFFETASKSAAYFAVEAEIFFEVTKNESTSLLLKLRQVPSAQRFLPMHVKLHLTNYFAEMELIHIMLSEIIDQTLEYISETLRSTQNSFIRYADIQRYVLRTWNFKPDKWCFNRYIDFLQKWSADIFKCAAGSELNIAYDVYAMMEVNLKYILRQFEFRIQRLFNCFVFENYKLRCRFLRHAEQDFDKLFVKLQEMQMYYDTKTKHGRVSILRSRRRQGGGENEIDGSTMEEDNSTATDTEAMKVEDKCMPCGFPDTHMPSSLKSCFSFTNFKSFRKFIISKRFGKNNT